jgi:filamentous hemagglutinin
LPRHTIPDERAGHIFRNTKGHVSDTPENRSLLVEVADDPNARLGIDRFGNVWSARVQPDGTQIWTQTRGNQIVNGGLNRTPRSFDPLTGLSDPLRRGEGE